ncbi:MAG: TatD family hydrolase [Phycisphaerae bacterium]|nr:TatD family hydrolase [Gemmatimonadaceae bacterium]
MFEFADSHTHLADAAFAADADEVIARARAEGAQALVCIGESPSQALRAEQIALRYPGFVWFTCGVHPHDAHIWNNNDDAASIRAAVARGAVAVGECGLDYHYDHSPREQQRNVLGRQLELAAELQRPIVLHTREAEDDTHAFLRDAERAGVQGVLHCFTGSHALAEAGLAAGWYVSFSGVITFKKFTDVALLNLVPANRLLVESDAPYLAPVPHRGRRNEPSWVAATLERLATARAVSVESLASTTLENTRAFFGLEMQNHARVANVID